MVGEHSFFFKSDTAWRGSMLKLGSKNTVLYDLSDYLVMENFRLIVSPLARRRLLVFDPLGTDLVNPTSRRSSASFHILYTTMYKGFTMIMPENAERLVIAGVQLDMEAQRVYENDVICFGNATLNTHA